MTTVRRHVSHHSITTSPLLPLGRLTLDQKNYDGDVQELCPDFTVTEESFGKRHVVELKSGGKDISVTNENKMQYIHAMADYKLNQQLLSGGNYDIDIDDLKNNTRYTGGYNEGSRTIKIFWEVIKGFEPKERCMLLKFVTSCSRAPLLGFKYLQPAFTIHKVEEKVRKWKVISIPKFSPSYSPSPTH